MTASARDQPPTLERLSNIQTSNVTTQQLIPPAIQQRLPFLFLLLMTRLSKRTEPPPHFGFIASAHWHAGAHRRSNVIAENRHRALLTRSCLFSRVRSWALVGSHGRRQYLSRETRALTTAASPKPSISRAVGDEPNHLARDWLDAVHVGNDAPRILLARGHATASAFATRPTRLMFFQGLAMPFPLRV